MLAPRFPQEQLIGQLGNNHNNGGRPDGLDVFKGLDVAIKEHAVSTKELAISVREVAGTNSGLSTGIWWNAWGTGLVVGLVIGALLTGIFFSGSRPRV